MILSQILLPCKLETVKVFKCLFLKCFLKTVFINLKIYFLESGIYSPFFDKFTNYYNVIVIKLTQPDYKNCISSYLFKILFEHISSCKFMQVKINMNVTNILSFKTKFSTSTEFQNLYIFILNI